MPRIKEGHLGDEIRKARTSFAKVYDSGSIVEHNVTSVAHFRLTHVTDPGLYSNQETSLAEIAGMSYPSKVG